MRDWSIQVDRTIVGDDGKPKRVRTIFQCEADNLGDAWQVADRAFDGMQVKFGAILPGKHLRF